MGIIAAPETGGELAKPPKAKAKVKKPPKQRVTPPPVWSGEAIAERLELTRRALGISQAEFARRAGIEPTTFNNYAQAVRIIPPSTAGRMCEVYGLTLEWIYRGDMQHLNPMLQTKINELRR